MAVVDDMTDEDLARDRELAQELARSRSPEQQRIARARFAEQAARTELGRAQSRRHRP